MHTRTIRDTSVALPDLDGMGRYLSNVTSLEGGRGRVADFQYTGAELQQLDLAEAHLLDGRVSALKTRGTRLEQVHVDSVEFTDCDLGTLQWSRSRISRAVFRDCRLMGAALDDVTLDNVLFENCRLDYATFTRVRATGPVIFAGCTLREATFVGADLGKALFDGCELQLTGFDGGKHRGLDLRGNDLSQLCGLASLKGITIDRAQTLQLAAALAGELEVTFGEDDEGEAMARDIHEFYGGAPVPLPDGAAAPITAEELAEADRMEW